jgi:urea transport system ATP-binding protein
MQTALTIDGLSVDFGGFRAVDCFSMTVGEGDLRVLLGANGAGKTTLMDLICGKTQSTEGRVFLGDRDITNRPEHEIARAGLGRKFQIPSVFRELTVHQNFQVAGTRDPRVLANLRGRRNREADARLEEILDLVGLRDRRWEKAGVLSHGETQWLELGLLLVMNPKVILLDEPTAGMTQGETRKTSQILNDLKGRHTLLVVEHDMTFVRAIAQRITVMHLGKFLAEGTIAQIETDPRVKDAYLGSGGIH